MINILKRYNTVIFTALIWAGYYFFASLASKVVDPLTNGLAIRIISFVILLSFIYFTDKFESLKIDRKAILLLIIIGFNGFMLDYTAFQGFKVFDAATGTLLLKSDVLMVNIASAMIYKQRFTIKDWIFTFITLIGVFMVLDINVFDLRIFEPGSLYFISSAFFVTLNVFVIRFVQIRYRITNISIGFYNNAAAMIWFLVCMLITGTPISANVVSAMSGSFWFLIPAAFGQSFIYIFYYRSLEKYPIWIVKIVLLLIPVFNMILNFLVFGNGFSLVALTGAVLVIGGAGGILYSHRTPVASGMLNSLNDDMAGENV